MKFNLIEPILNEKIWGGDKLAHFFQNKDTRKIGEAWVISAIKGNDCIFVNGNFKGKTLSEIYKSNKYLFGTINNKSFPLLIKFLDANDNLSIQVHPDDKMARKYYYDYGKSEVWYFLDSDDNSTIYYGNDFNDKFDLENTFRINNWDEKLKLVNVKKDDFFWIPAGTIHALNKGCFVYEVQQSSDLTYRIYDYDRKDKFGNFRELNKELAIEAIKLSPNTNENLISFSEQWITLTDNAYFILRKIVVSKKIVLELPEVFSIIGCIEGNVIIDNTKIQKGYHGIIFKNAKNIIISGTGIIMWTIPKI